MSAVILKDDEPQRQLPANPMQLLSMALQQGASIDQMGQLMALQERYEANEARRDFNRAFAAFKSEAIHVVKGTTIKDGPLKGKKHANLFDVVDAVTAKLAAHGMTISWRLTKDEKDWMEVTCTLRHVAGHSEQVSMCSAPDAGPGRNAIQARASAKSYLERYTATAILGLASKDQDDDGAAAGNSNPLYITESQIADLKALAEEVGADKEKFLRFAGLERLEDMKSSDFKKACAALRAKGKAK